MWLFQRLLVCISKLLSWRAVPFPNSASVVWPAQGRVFIVVGKECLVPLFHTWRLFHFLFALGTEGKSRVIEQEGRERQTKMVTNVGIFVLISWSGTVFISSSTCGRREVKTGYRAWGLHSPFTEDSVVCQGLINPQVKYGVSFWKTNLLNDFGSRSFAFLCFAMFLSHT